MVKYAQRPYESVRSNVTFLEYIILNSYIIIGWTPTVLARVIEREKIF